MTPVDVSASRDGRNGPYVRRKPRRFLTREQVAAGRGPGVGRGALTDEVIQEGMTDGYSAVGPWEVERTGKKVALRHYGFTIATAVRSGPTGEYWTVTNVRGRPGYGMSMSDRAGVWQFATRLMGYERARNEVDIPKVGLNPDARLRTAKHGGTYPARGMGSRVSPYATVDENRTAIRSSMGITDLGPAYGPGPRFPPRRGMRKR